VCVWCVCVCVHVCVCVCVCVLCVCWTHPARRGGTNYRLLKWCAAPCQTIAIPPTYLKKDPPPCQKRPTTMSKETYNHVERDTEIWRDPPRWCAVSCRVIASSSTYLKGHLQSCQKRPKIMWKETHNHVKRDPQSCGKRPRNVLWATKVMRRVVPNSWNSSCVH